jgi:hypothetical protein
MDISWKNPSRSWPGRRGRKPVAYKGNYNGCRYCTLGRGTPWFEGDDIKNYDVGEDRGVVWVGCTLCKTVVIGIYSQFYSSLSASEQQYLRSVLYMENGQPNEINVFFISDEGLFASLPRPLGVGIKSNTYFELFIPDGDQGQSFRRTLTRLTDLLTQCTSYRRSSSTANSQSFSRSGDSQFGSGY